MICKAHAFTCHPVNVGSFDFRRTIAAEIIVAKVIGHDEYDIRLLCHLLFIGPGTSLKDRQNGQARNEYFNAPHHLDVLLMLAF